MRKSGNSFSRSRIESKDEKGCGDLANVSFLHTVLFFALEDWISNKFNVCRSRDSVRNGCVARILSSRSLRGLGKFYQQANSRRYYLGTACQIVNMIPKYI